MMRLDSIVLLGERRYRISAVLHIGERYYLLQRESRTLRDIALLPAIIVERLAVVEPKPKPKLKVVHCSREQT